MAYWGGSRGDKPDVFPPNMAFVNRRHICTISEELPTHLGFENTGPVSLYESEKNSDDNELTYGAEGDYRLRFSELSFTGTPPAAVPADSFPPFPALCYYGGDRIVTWLKSQNLERHEYWRVRDEARKEYEDEWGRRHPFTQSGVDILVGGWHFMWPEDDFYTPLEYRLLFLTLRDAEPWFEVWHSPQSRGFEAKMRIS